MLSNQKQNHLTGSALDKVFLQDLKDSLATEHTLIILLPGYARTSVSLELTSTFDLYAAQTEENIGKLRQAFKLLGERPAQGSTMIYRIINKALESARMVEAGYTMNDSILVMLAKDMVQYQIEEYSKLQKMALGNDSTQISNLLDGMISQQTERQQILVKLEAGFHGITLNGEARPISG